MRALKILVVTMGVLILVGLAVVIATIVNRSSRVAFDSAVDTGPVPVAIPAGSRIVETRAEGDRLILRLALADGSARLLVLDIASGQTLRRFDVRPEGEGAPAR